MLTQLTQRKTSEVKVFQLRKKKGSMPTRKKIVGSGAFPELLRSFYGELLRRPRFFPQIFKFGSRGVKVYGQSLWSKSMVKVCGHFLLLLLLFFLILILLLHGPSTMRTKAIGNSLKGFQI
jgi:hypothetical protein